MLFQSKCDIVKGNFMKTGLVLEGGAMRGMFTAGVLDVFMENGIMVDCVVGVSAGALFGVNYLSEQKGRAIRYNKKFNQDKDYLGLRPLLREGNIVSTKYAYEEVPRKLDPFDNEQYMKSPISFYAVVTNVETGEAEYIQVKNPLEQMDVLRASGSMPLVSKVVNIGDKHYLDGGISNSIPYRWLHEQGCEKEIVILTRDMEYRKKPMRPFPAKLMLRKYPKVLDKMMHRYMNYNDAVEELKEWEQDGRAFVIRPSQEITIKRIEKDPDKLQEVYDLGRKDGEAYLDELKKYLERNNE